MSRTPRPLSGPRHDPGQGLRAAAGIALLLALAAIVALPSAAAHSSGGSGAGPITNARWVHTNLPGNVTGANGSPPELTWAPRNATIDAQFRFRAQEPFNDTVHLEADNGTLNRTTLHVDVEANKTYAADVEIRHLRVPPSIYEDAHLVVRFENTTRPTRTGGQPIEFRFGVRILPQVRGRMLTAHEQPGHIGPLLGEDDTEILNADWGVLNADWDEPVTVKARLENPWDVPTGSLPLQLLEGGTVVATRNVSSFAPGESRTVTVATVTRENFPDLGARHATAAEPTPASTLIRLALATPPDEPRPEGILNYTYPSGSIHDQGNVLTDVTFVPGVRVLAGQPDVTLGEPVQVPIEVRHRGGTPPTQVTVDLHLRPSPWLDYGLASSTHHSLETHLAPGESRFLNLTLTPRVALPHGLETRLDVGARVDRDYREVDVDSSVDVRLVGDQPPPVHVGESIELTYRVRGSGDASGRLAVAATALAAYGNTTGPLPGLAGARNTTGPPFSTLVTTRDLVDVAFTPSRVETDQGQGSWNRTLTAELEVLAAGQVAVVPYVASDGLVYGGIESGRDAIPFSLPDQGRLRAAEWAHVGGVVGLRVLPAGEPGLAVLVPPVLMGLGLVAIEVHRRWYVR